eukprot:Em0016g672a
MPKANPRQSTQSPRLAALLLGHNERNRGSNSSSSDSSPSRSRSCRRHKKRRHSKRHHQDHNPLGAPLPSSTLHRGRKRAENTQIKAMLQYQSTICQLFSTFGPIAALKYDKLFRCTKRPDPTLGQPEGGPAGGTGAMQQLLPQWLSPMQLARRCATVSMLEGAIGPLSQAAEGLTLADPANTCPCTPPVATCMHELQQAMQDSLGCCQRRLYPCPLDTRRFPRRTARAVRAARYGDQPRFQAAGDGVPSMAYIRGGRAAQVGYNYGNSISSSSSSSSSASAARHSKRHRRDKNPLFSMSWLPELVELYDMVINLASMHKQASHLPHSIAVAMASICRSRAKGRSKAVECTLSTGGSPLLTSSHLALQQPLMPLQQPLEATSLQCHSWPQQGTPGQHHPVHSDHLGQMTLAGSGTPLA